MSQCDDILHHLQTGNPITSFQAYELYGITQLSARITDLKNRGHKISTRSKKVTNRFGKKERITEYFLGENNVD